MMFRWSVLCWTLLGLGTTVGAESGVAWRMTLRPTREAAIFDVAEDARVTATIQNVAGPEAAVVLEFEVNDADGRRCGNGSVSATVPVGEIRNVELRLGSAPQLPSGEYLTFSVRLLAAGRCESECRKGFGFLPRRAAVEPPASSPFGLLAEHHWPLLQRLGVRHVRPNWSWTERPLEWATRYQIAYCPLVNEANAFVRGELTEREYTDFVGESVRRYKGYVRYWQLGNEFDVFHREGPKAYVEAQRVGFAAAKAADPQCLVIGGSITELQVRREGFCEALELGLAKYCDVYDFHFYADLQTTQELLDYIHDACQRYTAQKPIWVTETTQVGMFDNDDRNQAECVFKRYAHLLANGVSVVFWHALDWPYPYGVDQIQATALIDYEGFARPSLFAYAALTRELAAVQFLRRWETERDVYALEFAQGLQTLLVLWSEHRSGTAEVRHPPGDVFITYPNGRRVCQSSATGVTAVGLAGGPALYQFPGAVSAVTYAP
ncbi:MAG: glycoside hydrolase 5 family protein [Pirellulaceae bacterium]